MSQLGNWVTERRIELGLTQSDVSARGGPSHQTLRNIEQAEELPPIRAFTATRLEQALRWQPGSISRAIRFGEKPEPKDVSVEEQVQQLMQLVTRNSRIEARRQNDQTSNISFRCSKRLHDAIRDHADASGVSISEAVRALLEDHFL